MINVTGKYIVVLRLEPCWLLRGSDGNGTLKNATLKGILGGKISVGNFPAVMHVMVTVWAAFRRQARSGQVRHARQFTCDALSRDGESGVYWFLQLQKHTLHNDFLLPCPHSGYTWSVFLLVLSKCCAKFNGHLTTFKGNTSLLC